MQMKKRTGHYMETDDIECDASRIQTCRRIAVYKKERAWLYIAETQQARK